MTITLKQQLFAQEYLLDLNATRAAIRAGYSPATASSQGHRLLRNVEIREKIERLMEERSRRTGITAERVHAELGSIGLSNIVDYFTFDKHGNPALAIDNLSPAQMAAITKVRIATTARGRRTIRLTLADKLAALITLSKHLDIELAAPRPEKLAEPPVSSR